MVETNARCLIEAVRQTPEPRHVCLEEGTLSGWLDEVLSPHAERKDIVGLSENPRPEDRRAPRSSPPPPGTAVAPRAGREPGERFGSGCEAHEKVHATGNPGALQRRTFGARRRGIAAGAPPREALAIPESRTLVLFFTQSRNVLSRDRLRATLTRVSAFAPYLAEGQRSGTMHPEELPVPELLGQPPGSLIGHFVGPAGEGGAAPVIEISESEGRLHAAITPPGMPSSPPFELIHLGQNRLGLGGTVDGTVVEYLPDGTRLEFRSLDSDQGFGVIQLPGPQSAALGVRRGGGCDAGRGA